MKKIVKKHPTTHRPGASIILSLALVLVTSQTFAADDVGGKIEKNTSREFTRDQRDSSLRFTASGRTDRSVTVAWADLDLSRTAGLGKLYQRLTRATSTVCSPRADIRNIGMYRDRKACLEAAMDSAVSNVGHLGLEEMHANRTGRSIQPKQELATR